MNCTTSCLAQLGLEPQQLLQLAFSAFIAVLFVQSGLDKVFNWKGEKEFYTKHFGKSILRSSVPLLLPVITLVELSAGLLCAIGFFQVLLTGNTGIGTAGMLCAVAGLTMLFFGQRVAKDYKGAAVLVPYFLLCAAGLWVFTMA
ncbi:MAG: DoxX family membrane protein [Flavobacteriales bacterium]|nr:DoxX family membrane protein [Flavobacteriales bacterium]MBP9080141.1 DoxX family membrane protein [Flavobacteriales bacterium]